MDHSQLYSKRYSYFFSQAHAGQQDTLLIFIHGFPDNAYIWWHQFHYFSSHYNVLVPFAPGTCSRDDYRESDYNLEVYVSDMELLIASIPENLRKKIYLIGHDLGGTVVEVLGDKLENVKGVIFINSVRGKQFFKRFQKRPVQALRSSYMLLFQLPIITRKNLQLIFSGLKKLANILGRPIDPNIEPHLDDYTLNGFEFYRALARQRGKNKFNLPRKYKPKTLFIWGKLDPFLLMPDEFELNNYFEDASLVELDASHWVFVEQYEKTNRVIQEFIQNEN